MPWREVSKMEQRREFVRLAMQEAVNRRELCRRFEIHPDTGYKWLGRFVADEELVDRSRRPHSSPGRTAAAIEDRILSVRDAHPAWGARKIVRCLEREGLVCPAHSTVHEILRRHDRIVAPPGGPAAQQRFEKPAPNLLWQMDFKGWLPLANGSRCHPLTVLDDHSRYSLCLEACANEQANTVQSRLELTFRHYGLPDAVFVDNGAPWGDSSGHRWTRFAVWLLKLGVDVLHSRPYHPQSRGKNERFHRTLKAEVFAFKRFRDLVEVQRALDRWRTVYNLDRPMRLSVSKCRRAATGRARAPFPNVYRKSLMTTARSSAACRPATTMSASKDVAGRCRRPSAASPSPSGRSLPMAATAFSSLPTRSQIST